jgi:hypothetical protein
MEKPDVVTLVTTPDAPPAAGPDRALDAPRPAGVVEAGVVVEVDVAFADGDEPQPAKSTINAHIDAAPTIHRPLGHRPLGFDSKSFMMAFLLLTGAMGRV